ncbi:predicted protein [Nematostella vectensis]|nr:predicted protein [Nematostella vectensis]|eukprot:XP_001630606.1 predicted protein [Nematostella vectensis]
MIVDLVAGGLGGSTGVILTCPLDVIQTRLQSSAFRLQRISQLGLNMAGIEATSSVSKPTNFYGVFSYGRYIARTEGARSLFKGLCPNLLAVTPSRAIYFTTYQKLKEWLNNGGILAANSSMVYLVSGASAQIVNSTITNPLWFLKTRLQLDFKCGREVKLARVVRQAYATEGIRAFYKGLSASYLGSIEVGLHFAIYENLKQQLLRSQNKTNDHQFTLAECTLAAGSAKVVSTGLCYPYEVVRTRLRQQESDVLGKQRYRTCLQTLRTVFVEEGWFGLYGGLGTNLMKQVPFTTVMFCVYEGVIYMMGQ